MSEIPNDFITSLRKVGVSPKIIDFFSAPIKLNINPETAKELKQACEKYLKGTRYMNSLMKRYNL